MMNLSHLIAEASHDGFYAVAVFATKSGVRIQRTKRGQGTTRIDIHELPEKLDRALITEVYSAVSALKSVGWNTVITTGALYFSRNPQAAGRLGTMLTSDRSEVERKAA